jgi:hypothetical protein
MGPALAVGTYADAASLRRASTPLIERYARLLGKPWGYRFVVGDTATDDGYTAILPNGGGGVWRITPEDDKGPDIATLTGSATIGVYGGLFRVIPQGLTGNVILTLDKHDADGALLQQAMPFEILRQDTGAHTVTINNGLGTLCVLPVSQQARFLGYFDAAGIGDWLKRDAHVLL